MKSFALALMLLVSCPAIVESQMGQRSPTPATPSPALPTSPPTTAPSTKHALGGQVWVGETAPDFELDASSGAPVRLSRLRGDWVLLIFADRRRDLAELLKAQEQLADRGMRVVGVCHEKPQSLISQAARDGIDQLVLADVTGEISGMYGLYDWERSETRPGFFVIDREGIVRLGILGRLFPADETVELMRYTLGTM